MRESALFGTMFGLGAGAVLVGVTVSRLVVGQAPEKPAGEPPAAAAEIAPAVVATPAPPPAPSPPVVVATPSPPPPAVVSSATEAPSVAAAPAIAPPPETTVEQRRRGPTRRHLRAPAIEETPLATGSVPAHEAEAVPPATDGPVAIVRGGAARPAARASGARIIQVEPQDAAR